MSPIFNSILELIGHTPLVRLSSLVKPGWASILVKLEFLNPGGSIKERVALAMVAEAEARGLLKPGGALVEATSGNTGVALAMLAAVKGYRAILVMPESLSPDYRRVLLRYGAEVVLTPAAQGMSGALSTAERLVAANPDYFMPRQFDNPINPQAHRQTTAPEILRDTEGKIHAFVAGIGTGGTITGVGEELKKIVPGILVVGVEPARSPLLSQGRAGPHGIPGIGANFRPPILNRQIIDEIITVSDEEAGGTSFRLAREEGILAGLSGGANVFAGLKIAERLGKGKTVVTVLPDSGDRPWNLALAAEAPEPTRKARGI